MKRDERPQASNTPKLRSEPSKHNTQGNIVTPTLGIATLSVLNVKAEGISQVNV